MSSPWMSPNVIWVVFLVLLALTLLTTLRFDWLKVWWQDQLRQATDADRAENEAARVVALPKNLPKNLHKNLPKNLPRKLAEELQEGLQEEPRLRRRAEPPAPASRTIQAARAPAHRNTGMWTHTTTPHAAVQRTLFHRSGRRH